MLNRVSTALSTRNFWINRIDVLFNRPESNQLIYHRENDEIETGLPRLPSRRLCWLVFWFDPIATWVTSGNLKGSNPWGYEICSTWSNKHCLTFREKGPAACEFTPRHLENERPLFLVHPSTGGRQKPWRNWPNWCYSVLHSSSKDPLQL